jgi:hypothetical protein
LASFDAPTASRIPLDSIESGRFTDELFVDVGGEGDPNIPAHPEGSASSSNLAGAAAAG